MSILEDLRALVVNKPQILHRQEPYTSLGLSNKLIRNWLLKAEQKNRLIFGGLLIVVVLYVLSPSLKFPSQRNNKNGEMLSKRPDRHTTGFINLRNDCFANSSLQAYSALPGFTQYLNDFINAFNEIEGFMADNRISEEVFRKEINDVQSGKAKAKGFEIPLHIAIANIVKKLQATQTSSRTISAWTFLHSVEKIFNAKISRSQHDAQELTQLINETLESENLRVQKALKKLQDLHLDKGIISEELNAYEIPHFPFNGLILSQMTCLSCQHHSKPHFAPFLMLTLHVPETYSANLESMLESNEKETISDYHCLNCRVLKIVNNENHLRDKGLSKNSEDENAMVNRLVELSKNELLSINEDLPNDLEEYVKSYNKAGLDISKVTSTVMRRAQILKPPKIFGIHLSRSSFNGVEVTRNSCQVTFNDNLNLSIGKQYSDKIKQLQQAAEEELEADLSNIKSKILTTDSNDVEDEDVQREDIDQQGTEDEDQEEEDTSGSETEGDDTDSSSITSNESSSGPFSENSVRNSANTEITNDSGLSKPRETIGKSTITQDQTGELVEQFKQFRFNDNDVYKYRLKSIVKHQGSHTQGHYECYKKKPLYVRNKEGTIFKLSPEIQDSVIDLVDVPKSGSNNPTSGDGSVRRKFSLLNKRRGTIGSSDNQDVVSQETNAIDDQILKNVNEDDDVSGLRKKLSTMMGRRPSIYQADPAHANIQEIIPSGLTTPAEVLVNDLESDYFSRPPQLSKGQPEQETKQEKVKMKKIPSLIKSPYWRISDATVDEVSKASVLYEKASVYMLYYERVDRKQIKKEP